MNRAHFDIAIVGGGIVALTAAIDCSRRRRTIGVIHGAERGIASTAAAGMLAPSIESASGAAGVFAYAARDMYPEFIADLGRRSGSTISFDMNGILELIAAEDLLAGTTPGNATLISPADLQSIEPQLRFAPGTWALLHPNDGWVDNGELMQALWKRVRSTSTIRAIASSAVRVSFGAGEVQVQMLDGSTIRAAKLVLAAGAWTSAITGIPTAVPVTPRRGQMLSVHGVALQHVIVGSSGYAVPRTGNRALLGSTMEDVGFDSSTTEEGVAQIRRAALEISTTLFEARESDRWAGLRPMTPDAQPIIGFDPATPTLIYGCGHGRNGILLGPLTGSCVAALATEEDSGLDLSPFSVGRFVSTQPSSA